MKEGEGKEEGGKGRENLLFVILNKIQACRKKTRVKKRVKKIIID